MWMPEGVKMEEKFMKEALKKLLSYTEGLLEDIFGAGPFCHICKGPRSLDSHSEECPIGRAVQALKEK